VRCHSILSIVIVLIVFASLSFEAHAQTPKTVLLDINPINATEDQAEDSYAGALKKLTSVERLGEIFDRSKFQRRGKISHPLRVCRGPRNVACLKTYSRKVRAWYSVYGELIGKDDGFALKLWLLDVGSSNILRTVEVEIAYPEDIKHESAQAACLLTMSMGCKLDEDEADIVAGGAVVPLSDDEEIVSERSPEPEKVEESPSEDTSDEEDDWDDEKKEDAKQAPTTEEKADEDETGSKLTPVEIGGWVLISTGIASVTTAAIFTGLTFSSFSGYEAADVGSSERSDLQSTIETYQISYWTLYGVGGAMLTAGILMVVLGGDSGDDGSGGMDAIIAPTTMQNGASGLAVFGRF